MKKMPYMSAAKKARIALAVMAVCGFTLSGAQSAFAENVTIDANKNIICGEGATATGSDSIALGTYAVSKGENSVAIGTDSEAEGNNALALGVNSRALEENTVALGRNATALAANSTAIGYHSEADAKGSLAIGAYTDVSNYAEYSVAIGVGSYAGRANSISVGGGWLGNGPQYRQITNVADGTENHDAATYGQILKKDTYTITINNEGNGETKLVTNASEDGPTITIDASALNTKITENANAIGTLSSLTTTEKGNLVGAVNEVKGTADTALGLANTNKANIGSLSADGKYIKKDNNVSANLVELDNQVNANATDIIKKANLDLSNINTEGENKIKELAGNKAGDIVNTKLGTITSTNYVSTSNTVNANISALDTQLNKVENKIGTMTDGNYISAGNTVAGNLSALDNQLKTNTDAINTKADKDLSNITDEGKKVIKDLAGNKAGEVVDAKLGDITSENYVKKDDTVNANISALDKQVKANADVINTKADKDLSNITDEGKNVIKDLAGNKAGEVVDAKLGDITSENYVKKDDTVNANISALDKQMKVNTDNIGDTSKLTAEGLGSNLSDAVVNVNNKVGTADELKALKDAGLGDNLAQATAAVNKKADKNAEDIKTVNGRVDELGGRVDTLGGAVSKLDTKVNKVGAGAAALAALHPMDFDPDNKLSFAAGVGSYHGASAVAIGAFYRPSEQVMFSISGNMGNGENMVNAGVSFALDRPSKTPTTKAALVKTVAAQNEQIAALKETVSEQNEKIARLEAMVEKLAAKQST